MKILSHRGYWKKPSEKNSLIAFTRSLGLGFGLETDVRDYAGQLVISHDMPNGNELNFERVVSLLHGGDLLLAVNVKADGLAVCLKNALATYNPKKWFAFDMSVPDMRNYLDEELPVFARASEVERDPAWLDEVSGIWFDSFGIDRYDICRIAEFLSVGKQVCIVSPELHRWPYESLWAGIAHLADEKHLMLCTDYPEKARRFFMHA